MIRAVFASLCLLVCLAAPSTANAQAGAHQVTPQLALSARGEVRIAPDQASVSAGVVARGDTAAEALRLNARQMAGVFRALRQAGVAERDIQTSQLSVNPVYANRSSSNSGEAPRIVGYEARNTVTALVRDLEGLGAAIDSLIDGGANQLYGVNFSASNIEAARDDARRAAVAQLMARRDLYADAAGFEIKRLISFSEAGGGVPVFAARMQAESFMSDAATQVAPGELSVDVTVNAVWEIEG